MNQQLMQQALDALRPFAEAAVREDEATLRNTDFLAARKIFDELKAVSASTDHKEFLYEN